MADVPLVRGVYALTHTKRGRFLWCAWWKAEPCADPFRAPDAWGAGERTAEAARKRAEAAAGMELSEIEGRWAGAWVRVRNGRAPFPRRVPRTVDASDGSRGDAHAPSAYALLGVAQTATVAEVKAAFRQKITAAHPDQGGDPVAFMAILRAYEKILERRSKPRRRR